MKDVVTCDKSRELETRFDPGISNGATLVTAG